MVDSFPRRNLSPESEEWGREVETRVNTLQALADGLLNSTGGLNRTSASTLGELSFQLSELERLYQTIPRNQAATSHSSGFAVGAGWTTVTKLTLSDSEASHGNVVAVVGGLLVSGAGSSLVGTESRLLLNGSTASPIYPGAYFPNTLWYTPLLPTFAWEFTGNSATVEYQIRAEDAAMYPAGTASQVSLSLSATFYS